MNPVPLDPDIKVNMSLDEIIRLSNGEANNVTQGITSRSRKKKKSGRKKSGHTVPLLTSSLGVGINVSKKSPLLNSENQKRVTCLISNRALNSELLQRSKEIVPAEYIFIRTNQGIERVLVPTSAYFQKSSTKFTPESKMKRKAIGCAIASGLPKKLPDRPPPLVAAPIPEEPLQWNVELLEKQAEGSDDEVVLLEQRNAWQGKVIDVETNQFVNVTNVTEMQKGLIPEIIVKHQRGLKTLNERFTMLAKNIPN